MKSKKKRYMYRFGGSKLPFALEDKEPLLLTIYPAL